MKMRLKKLGSILLLVMLTISLTGCSAKTSENEVTKDGPVHAFTVGEDKQVYFAPGNLQYNPAEATWRFAPNAYDIIGEDNALASADYDGWLDLLGWGANGLSGIEPYCIEEDNFMYGDGHNNIAGTDYDMAKGYNAQSGENWRMFTHDEIHYLLMYRDNAEKLFGYGTINGVRGLFILPDDWVCPEGIDFTPSVEYGFANQYDWYYTIGDEENYTYNNYTDVEWQSIEEAGGVFLPAAGMRCGSECSHTGISGHYWTSSYYGEEFANCLCLFEHDLFLEGNFDRCYGLGVRLVKDAE